MVRTTHETEITKRKRYFGVLDEQLHLLRRLRGSVVDLYRLNITTACVVMLVTTSSAVWKYGSMKGNPIVFKVFGLSYLVHLLSNPVLYILVSKGLRTAYKKKLMKFLH